MKSLIKITSAWLLLSTLNTYYSICSAQGRAFTYQGRLSDGVNSANGTYDLKFSVNDALVVGALQGSSITNSNVAVSNGLFTVALDFGSVFPGQQRWLEIGVRKNESVLTYSVLPPAIR